MAPREIPPVEDNFRGLMAESPLARMAQQANFVRLVHLVTIAADAMIVFEVRPIGKRRGLGDVFVTIPAVEFPFDHVDLMRKYDPREQQCRSRPFYLHIPLDEVRQLLLLDLILRRFRLHPVVAVRAIFQRRLARRFPLFRVQVAGQAR